MNYNNLTMETTEPLEYEKNALFLTLSLPRKSLWGIPTGPERRTVEWKLDQLKFELRKSYRK